MNEPDNKQEQPFLTLELDGGPKDFESINELAEWAESERAAMNWLQGATKGQSAIQPAWNTLNGCLSKAEGFCKRFAQLNDKQRETEALQVKKHFAKAVQAGNIRTHESPDVAFVESLRKHESDVIAAYAYAFLTNHDFPITTSESFAGAHFAMRYRLGSSDTVKAQKRALESAKRGWSVKFGTLLKQLKSDSSEALSDINEKSTKLDTLIAEANKEKSDQNEAFNRLCEVAREQFDSITQTYDEKLALQASVTYWGEKKSSHNLVMWVTGIASVVFAAATAGIFIWVAYKFFQVALEEVEVWKFGVLLAISTFGIWLTRLFGKIFIANLHLRTDAQERETMILTYLAMLREGDVLKSEERELILQVVFRPSVSGYIKDDGPKGFGEMVSSLLSRR